MANGLGQGNVASGLILTLNEAEIARIKADLYRALQLIMVMQVDLSYFDDNNKCDSLRKVLIDHWITAKIALKFNMEFAPQKTELSLYCAETIPTTQTLELIDHYTVFFNGNSETLGVVRGDASDDNFRRKKLGFGEDEKWNGEEDAMNIFLRKKIDKIHNNLDVVENLENDKQRFNVILQCIRMENFGYYIANYKGRGITPLIMNKLESLTTRIMNMTLRIPVGDREKQLILIGNSFGGIGLRSMNNMMAPIMINSIHCTIVKTINFIQTQSLMKVWSWLMNWITSISNDYNENVMAKHKIEVKDVMHGIDIEFVELCITNRNLNGLIEYLCSKNLKYDSDAANWHLVNKRVDRKDPKLSLKQLMLAVESKQYHDIYSELKTEDKILANNRRSKGALSFMDVMWGTDGANVSHLSNMEWNHALRQIYNIGNLLPKKEYNCIQCGMITSDKNHWWSCREGKAHTWRHDRMTAIIHKAVAPEFKRCVLEKRPSFEERQADAPDQRPDMIIHDGFQFGGKWIDGAILDTLIYDINRIDNKKCYDDGKEGIGIELKCGTKEKLSLYSERFTTLKRNGYKVLPLVLSSVGGMNKELRQLLYTTAQYKSRRTGRGSEVIYHNMIVGLAVAFQSFKLESHTNHQLIS
eukprot:812467_1